MKKIVTYLLLISLLAAALACKKQSVITSPDAILTITADTLRFDTVFTSVGSVTQYFTIINSNAQKLQISDIKLMGGNNSAYKMIVDGIAAPQINNLEINAGDSIYVFVSVTINPTAADLPFIVQDSIQVTCNGNQKLIQLQAYGQNAQFFRKLYIDKDTTWTSALPVVIVGGVQVAENSTLTIEQGCRIYLQADAPFVVDGTIKVKGTAVQPVIFQGARIDPGYRDLPASWPGIYLRPGSSENTMQFAIVKNAYQGIVAVGGPLPKLQLRACIIENIYDAGILAVGSAIDAVNCLISNCGSNLVVQAGGSYGFTHCTIVSYDNKYISHKKPVLTLSNLDEAGSSYDLQALFRNSIIWAGGNNVDQEVVTERKGNAAFDVTFDHVLYKSKTSPPDVQLLDAIANQDPAFDSINANRNYFDFHIGNKPSPAIGTGVTAGVSTDLDGRERVGTVDLGCYTKH